ncbi:MAG: hypothetical protein ABSF33_18570, partial [Acidimicrobiales bacterium]
MLEIDGTALDSREKRRELTATAPRGLHPSNLPVLEGHFSADRLRATTTFLFWNNESGTTR